MRFSICVPVYNVEDFIEDCVNSILNQTFEDFEVIFINDGSTDRSLEKLVFLCQKDNRVKIISKNNQGLLWARRDAIKLAKGEYILFVDSDDKYCHKKVLENLDNYIRKYNSPDLIVFNRNEFDCFSIKDNKPFYSFEKLFKGNELSDIRYQFITRNYFNAMFLKCIKRSVLQNDDTDYTKHNPQMAEDVTQSIFMFDKSETILYIPDIFYLYRVNPNSISNAPLTIDKLEKKMVRLLFTTMNNIIAKWKLQNYSADVFQRFYKKVYSFYAQRIIELLNNNTSKIFASEILAFKWFDEDNQFFNDLKIVKMAKLNKADYYLVLSIITKKESYLIKGYKIKKREHRANVLKNFFKKVVKRGNK